MTFWQTFAPKRTDIWDDDLVDRIIDVTCDFGKARGARVDRERALAAAEDYRAVLVGRPVFAYSALSLAEAVGATFDYRSPMIRLLDDPAWRESLKVAETPVEGAFHYPGCLFWAGRCNCARAWDTGE